MSFSVGENIGPYRIIEQLGQGGMATVYKAYHAALDRYVALKVLHPAFHQDQTFTARFQREARVVAKLEHPHIVPIYDYSEHEARPYLVMKFIEGDTLKARFSSGPLSAAEIEKVVDSVGSALAYAHKQGILHRDVKPSNVLLANDGTIYLADFGLARIAEAGESTLSSDSIMGTPQYISPEQAMGAKDLDSGTDVYSFGVMLYEMIVGQVPFSADTPFSIIHDHIYTPLPLPISVNPNVPEQVQRVLLKALAKQRADRYQNIDEMCVAFKNAWREAGVPMQGSSLSVHSSMLKEANVGKTVASQGKTNVVESGTTQSPSKRRLPWAWIIVAGLSILLCLVAAVVIRRQFSNRQQTPPTVALTPPSAATFTALPPVSPPIQQTPNNPNQNPNQSPEVTSALDAVNKDPGSPDAHLALALAYWDAGNRRLAAEELAQSANLAGPNNREFFINAAEQYKKRGAWVPAAAMYVRLVFAYSGEELPPEVEQGFRESIYKAAEQKDMPLFVFFERIDSADLPMGYIARGRFALYTGDIEQAKAQLENARKAKPDMYEVFLLQAEIDLKLKNVEAAKTTLLSLSSDLGAPEWIRTFANHLLSTIK
ncbi:MAG: protein kinase [Anaerolineales bacterium]|nr:protein kinase [Anaerolineales bacterium]MCZ2122064.1 protein kinase [Anaerolineales bacterium]